VHAGAYNESPSISKSNLTIQANAGDHPIVNGNFNTNGNCGITIHGMEITNFGSPSNGAAGILDVQTRAL